MPALSPTQAGSGRGSLLLQAALAAGGSQRLSVLIYHRVLAQPDPLRPNEPTQDAFERRMRWLAANFDVLRLGDAVQRLKANRLPRRALCITFDDGYADNHDLALPVLRRVGLVATFFIATGYLDGGLMFNDVVVESVRQARGTELDLSPLGLGRCNVQDDAARRGAIGAILEQLKKVEPNRRADVARRIAEHAGAVLPRDLMMSSAQVAAMHRAGMEIGAHTVNHPILATAPIDEARAEIVRGRERLQEIVGAPVRVFAYPNGRPQRDYRREHADLVRELGFDGAVSTAWGTARPGADPFQIPRFTPWDRADLRFGLRIAANRYTRDYLRA